MLYIFTTMCKITSSWEPAGIDRELSSVLRNDLEEWEGGDGEGSSRGYIQTFR